METQVENSAAPAITPLVSGIVHDAQQLMRQQLTLFQVELKNDLRRTRDASLPLIIGSVVALLGIVLLSVMLALLLSDRLQLPQWAGFAIVGGVVTLLGGLLIFWGKQKFDSFNPLPDKTIEGIKENIQWKTKT